MNTYYSIIIFILGLAIGSFINALVYRIENKKSINARSFCPNCKYQLYWYDLIPVISWILLRGKCRECGKEISFQYPLVEILTGAIFLAIYLQSGMMTELKDYLSVILTLTISSIFVIVALYDYRTKYVLSKYVYVGILMSLALIILEYSGKFFSINFVVFVAPYLLSALLPASFFYALYYFSKGEWMGEGDTEIALLMGLFLGFPKIIIAYYTAFIVGAIFGLTSIYFKKLKMKSEVPFGPFLVLGTFLAIFYGEKLFEIYVKIFLGG